jgi:predicted RNA-binding protein with RPS1 domain
MEDKIFKCPNDLKVTVKKDSGEMVLDENCCTGMVILLKNDGNMATSFYGYHNAELIRILNKVQKKYFKSLKKRLKTESIEDNIEVKNEDIPEDKKWDESKKLDEKPKDKKSKVKKENNNKKHIA